MSHVRHFSSYSEWVEACKKGANKNKTSHANYDYGFGLDWQGTRTFAEAIELAVNGWPQGLEKAKMLSTGLFNGISSTIERPYYIYDYEGSNVDIARYLDNEPECWQRVEYVNTNGPGRRIIKLTMNGGALAMVNGEAYFNKGAMCIALIDCLELAGHGVELELAYAIFDGLGGNSIATEQYITLKTANQPMDLSLIAFAVANPAAHRRLKFGYLESIMHEVNGISSYGCSTEIPKPKRGDIYIGYDHGIDYNSLESARAFIIEQLKDQGVVLSESAN